MQQQQLAVDGLPSLAPSGANDGERGRAIEARMVARYGAPSIEDYRRAYAGFGAEWPGDDLTGTAGLRSGGAGQRPPR
ncbi:MAG: hypothetical protein WCF33_12585 [Pseudonocardiaceae bacterium]